MKNLKLFRKIAVASMGATMALGLAITVTGATMSEAKAISLNAMFNIGDIASANSWENATDHDDLPKTGNISIHAFHTKGTVKYYSTDSTWRFYKNSNANSGHGFTVTADEGYYLESVYLGGTNKFTTYDSGWTVNNNTYTYDYSGNTKNSTFTISIPSNTTSINQIYVTYNQLETPPNDHEMSEISGPGVVTVGGTIQLTASCSENCQINWFTEDDDILSVDENGLVTGLSVGTTTVYAECDDTGNLATTEISVVAAQTHDVTISTFENTIVVGSTSQFTASCNKHHSISWHSSNTSVATINNSGLVTAIAPGKTTIMAICSGAVSNTVGVEVIGGGTGYYASITPEILSAGGQTLYNALASLNFNKRVKTVGYNAMGTNVSSSKYIYTDYDPDTTTLDKDGHVVGTEIVDFYSGQTIPAALNFTREHVWCASRLPGGRSSNDIDKDIHMTRPSGMEANGGRSNNYYSAIPGTGVSDAGDLNPSYRGDAARILFYTMLLDTQLDLNDDPTTDASEYTLGRVSELLEWNMKYAPLPREMMRNDGAEYLQGNRNPFIDHPEWVNLIWGNKNPTVVAEYSDFKGLNISFETTKMTKNSIKTIGVSTTEEATLTWRSSDTSIATVTSDGVVHSGSKGGTVVISVTANMNGTKVTKECKINIEANTSLDEYTLVTSDSQLVSGSSVIIAAELTDCAVGKTQNKNNRSNGLITKNNNSLYISSKEVCVFTLTETENGWTFYDPYLSSYLYYQSGSNNLKSKATLDSSCYWSISFSGSVANISNKSAATYTIQYNLTNTIFACYASSQRKVCLYATNSPILDVDTTSIDGDIGDSTTIKAVTLGISNPTISWTVENSNVCTISSSTGASTNVTVAGYGNTKITVTASNGSVNKTCEIWVTAINLEEFRNLELAIDWAIDFLNSITCDANGVTNPTFKSGVTWTSLAQSFNELDSSVKAIFANADYAVAGTGESTVVTALSGTDETIANCVARYDYMVSKYNSLSQFMGRDLRSFSGLDKFRPASSDAVLITGIVIMLLSFVAIAGVIGFRKKYFEK